MDIEAFCELYGDTDLCAHIKQQAAKHSSNAEERKDLWQEAWMRLAEEPTGQRSIDWYCAEASKAVHARWKREYRRRKGEEIVVDSIKELYSTRYE